MEISHTVWGIIVAAAFVSGAFLASPELRAYAADTVYSIDIVDGEVKSVDIGAAAVTSPKIGTGAVTNSKIGAAAVTTSKIADGTITAADIGTDAVGASELSANSVGASELIGVTKLIFVECDFTDSNVVSQGVAIGADCSVPGADSDDNGIVTNNGQVCFDATNIIPDTDSVLVILVNQCTNAISYGSGTIALIVYDK